MTEKNGNERNESNAGPGVGRRLFLKTAGIGGVAAASGLAAPALATGAKRKVVFVAHEDIPFFAPVVPVSRSSAPYATGMPNSSPAARRQTSPKPCGCRSMR